jgi:hypothetical protein
LAQYHVGNFEDAAEYCRRALRVRRSRIIIRTLLAALGQLGRREEAALALAEAGGAQIAAAGHWEVTMPYAERASRLFFDEGLRKAGVHI